MCRWIFSRSLTTPDERRTRHACPTFLGGCRLRLRFVFDRRPRKARLPTGANRRFLVASAFFSVSIAACRAYPGFSAAFFRGEGSGCAGSAVLSGFFGPSMAVLSRVMRPIMQYLDCDLTGSP
jgi:hypothetical protein